MEDSTEYWGNWKMTSLTENSKEKQEESVEVGTQLWGWNLEML